MGGDLKMRKAEFIGGTLCIVGLLMLIAYYQWFKVIPPVNNPIVVEETEGDTEGFEDAEDALLYLMAQIQAGDIDKALRVCAIEDVADYFNLELYIKYTEEFKGTDMVPACESEGDAYSVISTVRLAADYGSTIQKCVDLVAGEKQMEIYKVTKNEPENPDGKYFQRLRDITDIIGARDVAEYVVYVKVDGIPMELHFSMARYRRFWKVLQFCDLQMDLEEPEIVKTEETLSGLPLDLTDYSKIELPLNYFLINSAPVEETEELIGRFFMYLQRGDVVSALACYDFETGQGEAEFNLDLLERQKEAAVQIQEFYYQMLLNNADFAWAARHYEDTPEYLPELLRIVNMQYSNFYGAERKNDSEENEYKISYGYDAGDFESILKIAESGNLIEQMVP